ncbi:hypothetical protein EDB81DRAFT_760779 [Dactylonectria macrodidyma]|uniref:Uncharacterized protein n=1 Tax=Dactylonectria macrodidyma TaxID=307937 RepID=A0A9P9ER37_9HYPO|nr:hypothetical protein EDB81DRAFT_760779 [Dactylonectria macrodidyma]
MVCSLLRKRIANFVRDITGEQDKYESQLNEKEQQTENEKVLPSSWSSYVETDDNTSDHEAQLRQVSPNVDSPTEATASSNSQPKQLIEPTTRLSGSTQAFAPKRRRCEPCQQARASPAYCYFIAALMEPLYCAGCRSEKPAILFSYSSRRNESDESRLCIGHQGHCTVCPHVKFSLADIDDWKQMIAFKHEDIGVCCQVASCPCANATVRFHPRRRIVCWNWSAPLGAAATLSSKPWDRCLVKLDEMRQIHPALFCPHLQFTPNRFSNSDLLQHPKYAESQWFSCTKCQSEGECNVWSQGTKKINWSGSALVPDNSVATSWVSQLDPDSYGHFADQDTKHITWCDDLGCSTTYALFQSTALMELAMWPSWDPKWLTDGSGHGMQMLDQLAEF